MQHVKLLHHLCKETLESLRPEIESVGFTLHDAFNEVFSAPYVLNQLLALAAIHLSTSNTETQGFYRQQAKELQTHALSIFNQMTPEANVETCVPLFIFSSTLGLHEMCEAFFFRVPDFEDFLDNFIRYLSLHKGVRAITGNTWHLLNQSIVGPICKRGEHIMAPVGDALGNTCSQLLGLVKAANIAEEYKSSYKKAISALQSIFGGPHRDVPENISTTAILSWPVILDTDYIELLRMREPHALLILAHFGALVHIRRDMWIFGDGGQFLVTLIAAYLGSEWSNWLAWPIGVVNGQSDQVSD